MPRNTALCASYAAAAGIRRAIRAVTVTICGVGVLQACNGTDATAPSIPTGATASATPAGSATVGSTFAAPMRLVVAGRDGRAIRGIRVTWTASDSGTVAQSESVTNASGAASSRWTLGPTAGPQTLSAAIEGLPPVVFRATATADRAVAMQWATPAPRATLIGDTIRFDAVAIDRFGNVATGTPVYVVESGAEVISLVGGSAVARSRGVAMVRAALDLAVARVRITVDPAAPMLSRIWPDTLVPGAAIRIEGSNFSSLTDAVELTVSGVKMTVLSTTPTRIDALVPVGALPCAATGPQPVRVTIASASAQLAQPVRVARRVSLERGESINVNDADGLRCAELAAPSGGGRTKYVVAVINTSATASATTGFELRGAGAGAMSGQIASVRTPTAGLGSAAPTFRSTPGMLPATAAAADVHALAGTQSDRRADAQHDDFLDTQRQWVARAGSPLAGWRGSRLAASRAPTAVGDTISVKALYNNCAAGREIRARVVYAGSRALVLEDIAAPRVGQLDAQYRQIGDEFDRVQYPLLQNRVGDPLAMNAAMGGDGRITMLFTRYVNDSLPGIAGYVTACNFYAKGTFAGSNEDEVFYARVAVNGESPSDWRRTMRSTVVHEGKHLASLAERFARNTPLEETWLEESTARIAEELYSRTFTNGGGWKANVGFATSVRCEVYQCDDRPLMMWKHFSVLQQYMRGVDTLTPIGAAASGDFTFYASGWSLVRWAADQYATDESKWLMELVRGGATTGLAHLAQLTGRPAGEMLADWALAHAVDDLAGFTPKRAQLTFPSWNMADVNGGLASTYPGSFLAAPLKARAMSFGSFVLPVARLRAFSSSYFSFDGPQLGSQLLELRGENGLPTPSESLRLAIVRVE